MNTITRWLPICALLAALAGFGRMTSAKEQKPQKSEDFVFDIQPREITAGERAVLRWSIKGATKVTIEEAPDSGAGKSDLRELGTFAGSSGTLEVRPRESMTYVISCVGVTTYSCASVSVRVRVKPR